MLKSPGVQELRAYFAKRGYKCVTNYAYSGPKGLKAAWDTIIKPVFTLDWGKLGSTAAQVGSWSAEVKNNGDGTATYTITNTASTKSFLYQSVPGWLNHEAGPMGNIRQTFTWTEPIPTTWSGEGYPAG